MTTILLAWTGLDVAEGRMPRNPLILQEVASVRVGWLQRVVVPALLMVAPAILPGCVVPLEGALTDANGTTIYLDDALAIVNDRQLTEAQKRQALENLGITDSDVIDLLLSAG